MIANNNINKKLLTSESVGAGHPDKICDQISDAILDKVLEKDCNARVAIECMASNRLIIIGGELTTTAYVDLTKIAWSILLNLGYSENDFTIISNVHEQSPDISQGVKQKNNEIGAGDQGIVFGYAINETPSLMPLTIVLAHELAALAEKLRISKNFKWAKSDLKSQVTVDYSDEKNPVIDTIVMSVQHDSNYDKEEFERFIYKDIMQVVAKKHKLNLDFKYFINPTGKFVIGGPIGDTGLTGRKIIVDTYGGKAHHGGGAMSGKDPTKVDRSGAYAARWVAKNIVAAKLADEVEVQISYAIGITHPISIYIDTFGTHKSHQIKIKDLKQAVLNVFDLSPKGIIDGLNLTKTKYLPTATFGHFGRDDLQLPWEKINKVKDLLAEINKNKNN